MSIFSDLGIREGEDRLCEAVLYNIAACYSLLHRQISAVLAAESLSPVIMNALLIIKHVGGAKGLAQSEIQKRMIVTASSVTRLMDRLEKRDLIGRASQPGDRRVNLIRITTKGSKLLDKVWPAYLAAVDKSISSLSIKELKTMLAHLELFRASLQK